MVKLSVNVNKVATLRNTRALEIPSVTHLAKLALDAGAHGITVHPRPDARHIRPADVTDLAKLLKRYPNAEFNIEGNPFHEYMHFIESVRPTQCTLVPDTPEAATSDHGWDLHADGQRLGPIIQQLKALNCRVSLFMDPDPQMIERAARLGVDRIELYTEPYAAAFARGDKTAVEPYALAARRATELGLGVNAGHDLNLKNLPPFLQQVPGVLEVSIGHALIADALEFGMTAAVKMYLKAAGSGF
jgi:pyridoxine 5-phosphate synthase